MASKRLAYAAFASGASVMIVELLGSRIIAPFFGSSTYVWSAIIGVILASMTLGYRYGGRLADRKPEPQMLSRILLGSAAFVMLVPLIGEVAAALSLYAFGYSVGALFAPLIILALPAFLMGMVSPYAVRLSVKGVDSVGSTSGDLYAVSTAGSIAGTLACGFVLIPYLHLTTIFYLVCLILLSASFAVGKGASKGRIAGLGAVMVLVALLYAPPVISFSGRPVIYSEYTPYSRIAIEEENGVRYLMLDRGFEGAMDLKTGYSAYEYVDYFEVPFLQNPGIKDVLVGGGGAGVGPRQIRANHPDTTVTVAEINPRVNDAAKKYFNLEEDASLKVELRDMRLSVKETGRKFDYVVLDAFNDVSTVPYHLVTGEFFKDVRGALRPGGIFLINMHSPLTGRDSILLSSIAKTLGGEFEHLQIYPLGEDPSSRQNIIVLASGSPFLEGDALLLRVKDTPVIDADRLRKMAAKGRNYTASADGIAFSDDFSPADSLAARMLS
ncbi:MAG: fused MFS/spermidine synthase [Candidatus Altiarchaeota archaeon]